VARITVLVHEHDRSFDEPIWAMRWFCDRWVAAGHDVRVVKGVDARVDADVVVNHVDLTVTPSVYRSYMQHFRVGINRELVDISKPLVSSHLVERDDRYDGPVIVKTVANAGGARDLALEAQVRLRSRIAWKAARWTTGDLARTRYLPMTSYPVFEAKRDVPAGVWRNRHLVVERFLGERAGDLHVVRSWWYFGTRGLNTWIHGNDPIVKGNSIVARGVLHEPVPAALHQIRARLHADYGRIDYAVVDGTAVVYDLNRTPVMSEGAQEVYGPEIVDLAGAVSEHLP
jgi:hypothetical protein